MPLLGGLFHKRNTRCTQSESTASSASNRDSTDGDYVLPDKPPPVYSLPATDSSLKLRLPFRRKQPVTQTVPKHVPDSVVSLNDSPSPPRISSVTSDSGHALPLPPRKSSLFAIYNDSHNSVHSLPNDSSNQVHYDTHPRLSLSDARPSTGQPHKKSLGLLSWARERTKSKPPPPPPPPSSSISSISSASPSGDDSFNLKSFRHVGTDSPTTSPERPPETSPNFLLPPVRLRPRGDSVASDSSQRISVAAFREAQARSRANSPAPSSRPSSTADTLRVDANGGIRASTVSAILSTDSPQTNRNVPAMPSTRPDYSAGSSSDSESSEDDEEVDSDGEPIRKPARRRTITRRPGGIRSHSDAGHGPATTSPHHVSSSHQVPHDVSKSAPPLAYQSNPASYTRTRASVSTSALTPNGAARRASILAAANSSPSSFRGSGRPAQKAKEDSDESTNSSDTDSEDMPLRDLVAPRRPGSSASNAPSTRPRMPAKPLIDINSLAGGPLLLKPILRHRDSVKNAKHQEQDAEKDQPFSIPAALAFSSSTSPPITPSVSKQNATPSNKPSATRHRRSSSDEPTPVKSEEPDHDDDLMNAIRLAGVLDEEHQTSGTTKPSDRIVPTPIREREPQTSFTVLSRPHRQSIAETSGSLSPASQTHSVTTPPAPSHQPEPGTRQRTPSMTKFSVENDKSDMLSITSAGRSTTSRTSYNPPVPLIHSIPDSPSVKEGYKPGRPRSASRTSAAEARSKPPSTATVPPVSLNKMVSHAYQTSLMPQRPLTGNRSARGESPAGSSTGDSSSGRAPFTPRDGSDIGALSKEDDMDSTLKARGRTKKPTVTFEDAKPIRDRERAKTDLTGEERTRERRRSEAKAALELGKIVNGRGPLVHDGSDEDMLGGRNPTINVTMDNGANGMMPGWVPWQQPMGTGTIPMAPSQFNNDPAYMAAHQRALLIAKQAYQMAVAQHAMQMAGEEWERSSNTGFGSGGSVYGGGSGGSVYGGGSGGSAIGGTARGSVYGGVGGGAGMGPMPMMGMNMGMLMPPNQWGRSSVAFPGATGSVYGGISSSQSEYGGAGGGGWGTQSVYGNSVGSSSRTSFVGNNDPSSVVSGYGGTSRPRASTGVSPPSSSSARVPGKAPAARTRVAPPSSWKNGAAASQR